MPIKLPFILSGVCSPSLANYCSNPFEIFIRFLIKDDAVQKCDWRDKKVLIQPAENIEASNPSKSIDASDVFGSYITEEDAWILNANCFHLCAKFYPEGLHILLSHGKHNQQFMNQLYDDKTGNISPLHVAASKTTALSTR